MATVPNLQVELTSPFWTSAAEGRLELPHCDACSKLIWYPDENCPHCNGELLWRPVSGRGSVAAFTIVRRPLFPDYSTWAPYVSVLIALEEDAGVRVVSQLVDCDYDAVSCDMPVEVVFRELVVPDQGSYMAPLFKPRL